MSKIPTKALTKLSAPVARGSPNQAVKTPPRLVSDQLINIFFQEWAPLYPVVHRPTILKAYEQYLNKTDSLNDDAHAMAQLNLIFGIAALSSNVSATYDPIRLMMLTLPSRGPTRTPPSLRRTGQVLSIHS